MALPPIQLHAIVGGEFIWRGLVDGGDETRRERDTYPKSIFSVTLESSIFFFNFSVEILNKENFI